MKTLKIIKYVFLLIGIGALVSSFFLFKNTKQLIDNGVTVSGTVINIVKHTSEDSDGYVSYTYAPEVKFKTAEGKDITFESNVSSDTPDYSVNATVEVLYLPKSPKKARIKSFSSLWLGTFITFIAGIIFAGIGGGMIVRKKIRDSNIEKLKQTGQRLRTKLKEVELNTNLEVNGRNPYRIISQLNRGDEVYVFYSDNIWFDPSDSIQKDQEITVLVDPANMKKYWMDISFLPKLQD